MKKKIKYPYPWGYGKVYNVDASIIEIEETSQELMLILRHVFFG